MYLYSVCCHSVQANTESCYLINLNNHKKDNLVDFVKIQLYKIITHKNGKNRYRLKTVQ